MTLMWVPFPQLALWSFPASSSKQPSLSLCCKPLQLSVGCLHELCLKGPTDRTEATKIQYDSNMTWMPFVSTYLKIQIRWTDLPDSSVAVEQEVVGSGKHQTESSADRQLPVGDVYRLKLPCDLSCRRRCERWDNRPHLRFSKCCYFYQAVLHLCRLLVRREICSRGQNNTLTAIGDYVWSESTFQRRALLSAV